LSFLSSVVDDDKKGVDWQRVLEAAKRTYEAIFRQPRPQLREEERDFLVQAALVATICHNDREDWAGWLTAGERATQRKRPQNPAGFLRVALEKQLIYHLGLVESDAEAAALMGKLMAKARSIVHRRRRQKAKATA
jgi:hypothetical protein